MSQNDQATSTDSPAPATPPVTVHLTRVSPASEAMSRRRILTSGAAALATSALATTASRAAVAANVPGALAPRAGSAAATGGPWEN